MRYLRVDSLTDVKPGSTDFGLAFDVKAKFIHEKGFLPSAALVGGYNFSSVTLPQLRRFFSRAKFQWWQP